MLCSQHIILAIRMEFPPKEHQFSLLLTRKEKLAKCQEIPIISAGGKNTSVLTFDGCKTVFWKLFPLQNGRFCFTGNSQLHHLYRQLLCHSQAPPPSPETKTNKPKCSPKGVDSTTKTRK